MLQRDEIWVDYTNWHGKRAWRKVVPLAAPFGNPQRSPYPADGPDKPFVPDVWVIQVRMVDRKMAVRSLRMTSIHGFYVGEQPPALKAIVDAATEL